MLNNIQHKIGRFQHALMQAEAAPQWAVLGLISGITTGFAIVLFRWMITAPLNLVLPTHESFESLDANTRFWLVLSGAAVLVILFKLMKATTKGVGIAYVFDHFHHHQGRMSLRHGLAQWVGAVVALLTGQSVGREGPAIQIGATVSSLLGQWYRLPHNSLRTLVGCGAAAAIAGAFNTPIAGVIFSMEVIMLEYTLAGFTPIIIAAVSSALIGQLFYGSEPAFDVPLVTMQSLWEIPYILLLGAVASGVAVVFLKIHASTVVLQQWPLAMRLMLAGLTTAVAAYFVPQIMGVGYDSISDILVGQMLWSTMLIILVVKLALSAWVLGLGIPGGVIGPCFLVGASLGGLMGVVGHWLWPEYASSTSFYAMLGMGAVMGAVLHAPLAAMMAVLELTRHPDIMLPAMCAIVTAHLVSQSLFKQPSFLHFALKREGKTVRKQGGISGLLERVAVGALMHHDYVEVSHKLTPEALKQQLVKKPTWLLIDEEPTDGVKQILLAADCVRYLESIAPPEVPETEIPREDSEEHVEDTEKPLIELVEEELAANHDAASELVIDLTEIPAKRLDMSSIILQATLKEAHDKLQKKGQQALFVVKNPGSDHAVVGILLQEDIERYYR